MEIASHQAEYHNGSQQAGIGKVKNSSITRARRFSVAPMMEWTDPTKNPS